MATAAFWVFVCVRATAVVLWPAALLVFAARGTVLGSRLSRLALFVLFCHTAKLLLGELVATLELGHLTRLLVGQRVPLGIARALAATLSLGLDLFEFRASSVLVLVMPCSAGCSSCLAFGVELGVAICARHHGLSLSVGCASRLAHATALVSQCLCFVFGHATAGRGPLAVAAVVLGLVGGASALAAVVDGRSLLAPQAKHVLEAAHSGGSACDTSKRRHGVRVSAFATRSFSFALAVAGPFSLNWGRLHFHAIDNNRIVGARRCG
jgi:hypothetical protein